MKKKKGFTLAETLITLTIIGVIAAITVPALVQRTNKQEIITAAQKAYSTFAQVHNLSVFNNGPADSWEFSTLQEFFEKYYFPYLNISRDCGTDNTGACYYLPKSLTGRPASHEGKYRFYLSDGTLVLASLYRDGGKKWINFYIDINGQKKPNVYGHDLFLFNILFSSPDEDAADRIGKFLPMGITKSRDELIQSKCSGTGVIDGSYSAALIMMDGWQIREDNPCI